MCSVRPEHEQGNDMRMNQRVKLLMLSYLVLITVLVLPSSARQPTAAERPAMLKATMAASQAFLNDVK